MGSDPRGENQLVVSSKMNDCNKMHPVHLESNVRCSVANACNKNGVHREGQHDTTRSLVVNTNGAVELVIQNGDTQRGESAHDC